MRRMGQEITRSIVNYRRQKGAAAPKRILLNGRGALLEGLSEQLATSQKVNVEFLIRCKMSPLMVGLPQILSHFG